MEPTSTIALSSKALKEKEHEEEQTRILFGFWVYLMTDCVLFASLFAVYAVIHTNTFGGPSGAQIFNLPYVLTETLVLLSSTFCCGLASIALQNKSKWKVIGYFLLTFALGLTFLILELHEFDHLVRIHDSWTRSAFLSSYFTLVGAHGLHITVGLIWMAVMMVRIVKNGLTKHNIRRLKMLAIFWHFLDVIWIFIFTIVYLFGALHV